MKNATQQKSKWFRSSRTVVVALIAMISMTGCPSKKSDNNLGTSPYGYGYNYGQYCNGSTGCYGQSGYGQMFVSALGKIQSSQLHAEVALNFSTSSAYTNLNSYAGNTTIVGTMNVYSSSQFCPIAPGQYQVTGSGNFGMGMAALSFTGTLNGGLVQIIFSNNFLTPVASTSVMGPTFPFAVQNDVTIISQYGSCGVFVME